MSDTMRPFIIKLLMLSVIGAGAWYLLVRPANDELVSAKQRLSQEKSEIAKGQDEIASTMIAPSTAMVDLAAEAQKYQTLWAKTKDTSNLFDLFDSIAERTGVVIERMEPRNASGLPRGQKVPDTTLAVSAIGYVIELAGEYEAVARFMHALQTETGLTRIEMFRVLPASNDPKDRRVHASMQTTHFLISGELESFSMIGAEGSP